MKWATYLIATLLLIGMFFASVSRYAVLAELGLCAIALCLTKCVVGLPGYKTLWLQ